MDRYFWPTEHLAPFLVLVAIAILAVAWPLQSIPACVVAAGIMIVAAGALIRAHFHPASG